MASGVASGSGCIGPSDRSARRWADDRGLTMIAAIYAHVTPRKERERLAEYLK
jgi:hypothetical protein